jgi:hypothetical protein
MFMTPLLAAELAGRLDQAQPAFTDVGVAFEPHKVADGANGPSSLEPATILST